MTRRPDLENGPLRGLKVVDLSTVFAAPYIGGLLADLGAEVIKIEAPNRLDQSRQGGIVTPDNEPGDDPWNRNGIFPFVNRGKKSLVLDLKQEPGRAVLRALIDEADIVLDNFTPRVLRGWGMTYDALSSTNPGLIMLSNTGYGSGGPWSEFKAQGSALEATMGLLDNTGYPHDRPRKVGQSYPDFLAAWNGLFAIHAALVSRMETGRGQWIDSGMFQLGAAIIPEAIIAAQVGEPLDPPRIGNGDYDAVLSDLFPCRGEDNWLAVAVADADEQARISEVIAPGEDLSALNAFHAALSTWAADRDGDEAAALLQEHGIAAANLARVPDLLADPQFQHRRFFEWVDFGDAGHRPLIGRPYTWDGLSTVKIRARGPRFGEHNAELLERVGQSEKAKAALYEADVVADSPIGGKPAKPTNLEAMVKAGVWQRIDGDYRTVLDEARAATES